MTEKNGNPLVVCHCGHEEQFREATKTTLLVCKVGVVIGLITVAYGVMAKELGTALVGLSVSVPASVGLWRLITEKALETDSK